MAQPLINIGAVVNDGTGELGPRTWLQKINRLPNPDNTVNPLSGDYTGTYEQKITAAIVDAAATGKKYCWITQPYSASLVVFNNAIKMLREGEAGIGCTPRAYGAAGDNVQDDSAALSACDAAAKALGETVILTPGTYKIVTQVTVTGNFRHWYSHQGAIISDAVPNGPAIRFGDDAANMQHLRVEGLRLISAGSKHRVPIVSFQSTLGLNRISVKDLYIDGNNNFTDGVYIRNVFEGSFINVFSFNMLGGPLFVIDCPELNSGNINFVNCMSTTCPVLFLVGETRTDVNGNLNNSLHLDNCKLARLPALATNKFFAGTVAAGGAILGATVINVTAGQGTNYITGDWIVVATGTSRLWIDKVASVSTDAITLTAPGGLPFALIAGDPVVVGYWHSVIGPNVRIVRETTPHFERCNGMIGFSATAVNLDMPLLGSTHKRTMYLGKNCQSCEVNVPVVFSGTLDSDCVILHQANDGNNARNRLRGPVKVGSGGATMQVDGGFSGGLHVDRFGGTATLLGVWHQDTTVAANQTDVQLTGPMGAVRSLRMRSRGVLTTLVAQVSTARAAGTLTAKVFKNGSATTFTAVIDGTNPNFKVTEQSNDSGTLTFVPGDNIDIRVTTDAGWLPTANNLDVSLYVDS